ncbi:MAG: carboxypeptidase regulatory-like domain-containing protein [Pirellulales bacterium]
MNARLVSRWIAVAIVGLLTDGCSSKVRLAEVAGTVTKAGSPQKDVWVQFTPASGGRPAEGRTNSEGRYKLDYSRGRQGAPLGKHRVLAMTGGKLDAEGNEVTPRRVAFKGEFEVTNGENTIDIELP